LSSKAPRLVVDLTTGAGSPAYAWESNAEQEN
jgi:hypothetical protein